MRAALMVAGIVLAAGGGTSPSSVAREEPRTASRGFQPAAVARRAPASKELAARFAWPAVVAFQTTHQRAAGARPIQLVRGRALWWSEPEAVPGTPPAPKRTLPELIARGEAMVDATRRRDANHDRAFEALLGKQTFDDGKYEALTAEREQGARRAGVGRELPDVMWGLRRGVGDAAIVFSWLSGPSDAASGGPLPGIQTDEWLEKPGAPYATTSGSTTFVFLPTSVTSAAAPDPRAWDDWTYTTTLLAMDRPLYEPLSREGARDAGAFEAEEARLERVTRAIKKGRDVGLAAIRDGIAQGGPLDHFGWDQVARFAEEKAAVDLALAIRSRHMPVGRCSMDNAPAAAARRYADLCFAAGGLACFLNLNIQIMGDQFERVAYSSYGEAAHATEAQRLRDIGIDVERFLRGLLYRFDAPGVERRELEPWRLARSILEAKLAGPFGLLLRAEAARPDLDAFNRLRAAATLAFLQYQQGASSGSGAGGRPREAVDRNRLASQIRADLATLNLPEPAASWARMFGTE